MSYWFSVVALAMLLGWCGFAGLYLLVDIFKGVRKMTMAPGGVYPVTGGGSSVGTMYAGTGTTQVGLGSPSQRTTFRGPVVLSEGIEGGLKVDDIDVSETLKLLTFFLQSRHPEVIEEFKAIRKIEQS